MESRRKQAALISDQEVAERLGVSPWTLRAWRSQRVGPRWIKVGSLARYRPEDIEGYLETRTVLPTDRGRGKRA